MIILLRWLIMALALILSAWIVPGVFINGLWAALWLAVLLALINITLKPFLVLITLPINIFTLGLFTFVINALLVLLASTIIKGFIVDGFWTAMLFSLVLSFVSYFLNKFFKFKK